MFQVLIDLFNLQHFTFGEVQHEAVGTPYTVAPEVIKVAMTRDVMVRLSLLSISVWSKSCLTLYNIFSLLS